MKESSFFIFVIIIVSVIISVITNKGIKSPPSLSDKNVHYTISDGIFNDPLIDVYDSTINVYNNFYFNHLSDIQKNIYVKLVNGFENFDEIIEINGGNIEDFYSARNAVSLDRPEYFWGDNFIIRTLNGKVIEVEYNVPEDARLKRKIIDSKVDDILSKLPDNDVEKIKYIYDRIIENTEYGRVENSQDITSVLIDNTSVCAGYSRTFQYICQRAHIECTYVGGFTKDNESHGRNLVKVNDNYYWVDVTWGDSTFAEMKGNTINYNYFLASDQDFLNNHIIDKNVRMDDGSVYNLNLDYPSCTDDSLYFYNLKGCYFDSYDKNILEDYILDNLYKGIYKNIEFKFRTVDDYDNFIQEFLYGEDAYIFKVVRTIVGNNKNIHISYNYIEVASYVSLDIEIN